MNDMMKTVLSLSLSGSVIALALFAARPFIKDRLSKTWQYYIWVVVILRLLIPFTPEASLMNALFYPVDNNITNSIDLNISDFVGDGSNRPVTDTPSDQHNMADIPTTQYEIEQHGTENFRAKEKTNNIKVLNNYFSIIQNYLWLGWLFMAAMLFLKKVTSYYTYIYHIKSNREQISNESFIMIYEDVCKKAGVKRKLGLYSHKMIHSPMLIGFYKPYIVLPEALLNATDGLQYILMHELTHYKRADFLYKWLVQLAVCIHFFNPVIYIINKVINKTCEFSCDEMVIKKLDEHSKKAYGSALIHALEVSGGYSQHTVSVMLCEDALLIKERLGTIMKYKKRSKFILAITMILTATICSGAIFIGAYAAKEKTSINSLKKSNSEVINKDGLSAAKLEQSEIQSQNNNELSEVKEAAKSRQDSQNVSVYSRVREYSRGEYPYYIGNDYINNSDDIIKNIEVSLLAYDKEGIPQKITTMFDYFNNVSGEFELIVKDELNLLSHQTEGSDDGGWSISNNHGIVYIISCIKNIEFENQGKWENPYYQYWLEDYKEKTVSVEELKTYYRTLIDKTDVISANNVKPVSADLSSYRLSIDDLDDSMKSWIAECDKNQDIYVISYNDRWYIYCNEIPKDYAWRLDDDPYSVNGAILNLFDYGNSGDGYALLSIPQYSDIQIYYKNKRVQFTGDNQNLANNGPPSSISSKNEDFEVNRGVLTKYNGNGGNVVIPNDLGIISIGRHAFSNSTSLTALTIPDSVTSIEGYSFDGCKNLTSINIPEGVTVIESYTFYECTNLKTITMPSKGTSIGSYAFDGCTSLTSINIPNGVTAINNYTFLGCTNLTTVTLPDSLTSIGSYAFDGCTSLINMTLPDRIATIDNYAFYGCSSLSKLTIPSSVTSIGSYAFSGCSSLTDINILNGLKTIEGYVFFGCSSLTNLAIPSSVTTIKNYAFATCSSLDTVTIPSSVTAIENGVFAGCTGLTTITIPNNITSIGSYAFSSCSKLAKIIIPNSVTSINKSTFEDCDKDILAIYGQRGSYAESFAQKNGFRFVMVNN